MLPGILDLEFFRVILNEFFGSHEPWALHFTRNVLNQAEQRGHSLEPVTEFSINVDKMQAKVISLSVCRQC